MSRSGALVSLAVLLVAAVAYSRHAAVLDTLGGVGGITGARGGGGAARLDDTVWRQSVVQARQRQRGAGVWAVYTAESAAAWCRSALAAASAESTRTAAGATNTDVTAALVLPGDLLVEGGVDATHDVVLSAELRHIVGIVGHLRVIGSSLESLSGLNGVERVGGDVSVEDNARLASIGALSRLTSVGGTLSVEGNAVLSSLEGLNSLVTVGGGVEVSNNAHLTTIQALGRLTTIGGGGGGGGGGGEADHAYGAQCAANAYLDLSNNPRLRTFAGLEALASVAGDLVLDGNTALRDISALATLRTIGGGLRIANNAHLSSLRGLDNCVIGSGSGGGDGGETAACPPRLHYIRVSTNAALNDITALASNTAIANDVIVVNCAHLRSLRGLHNIVHIGGAAPRYGSLFVTNNPELTSFDVHSLQRVGADGVGAVRVENNVALPSLTGANALISVAGDVAVHGNTLLADVDALSGLTAVNGSLSVNDNASLVSLHGLRAVERVAKHVNVYGNVALVELGMDVLAEVGGSMTVAANPALHCDAVAVREALVHRGGGVKRIECPGGRAGEGEAVSL